MSSRQRSVWNVLCACTRKQIHSHPNTHTLTRANKVCVTRTLCFVQRHLAGKPLSELVLCRFANVAGGHKNAKTNTHTHADTYCTHIIIMSIKTDCSVARLRWVTNKIFACENTATKWPQKATNRSERVFSLWLPAEKPQQEPPFTLCWSVCVCVYECAEHCYKLKQSQIHTHTQHSTTLVCLGAPFHPRFPRKMLFMHFRNFQRFSLYFYLRIFYAHISRSSLSPNPQHYNIACNGALQFVVVAIVVAVALRHCCCCFAVIYDSNWVSSKFFCLVFTSSLKGCSKLGAKILPQIECFFVAYF